MALHKQMEKKKRKKMMYGRTPMEGGGMYGMKRKKKRLPQFFEQCNKEWCKLLYYI